MSHAPRFPLNNAARIAALAVALIIALVPATLRAAETLIGDPNWGTCGGFHAPTADQRIAACTAFIQTHRSSGTRESLALVYAFRGNAYLEKGDYDTAIRDFDESIRLDPKSDEAYIGRGDAYVEQLQYDRALRDL